MHRRTRIGRRSSLVVDAQLSLPFSWLSEHEFLLAMRQRGAEELERVRFRPNRTRLASLSPDRRSLSVQSCFRAAPSDVLDAIATFATAKRAHGSYRAAVRRLREWSEAQTGGPEEPGDDAAAACCATEDQRSFLARAYAHLNRERFGGRLPADLKIRLSARMSRRYGHVHYGKGRDGQRHVKEIALNVDLMLPGNERHFVDTLVHEMAHVEAWIEHGHRDHGAIWRRIAERVGCEARACTDVRIRRRQRRRTPVVTSIPALAFPA